MNAIKFLLQEHRKVKKTFAAISKKSVRFPTKKKMFAALARELTVHEKMEQTVWYPVLKKNLLLMLTIHHLLKEEKKAATAIKKVKALKSEEMWEKHFMQLKKDVIHHASEEEKKLFPKVKKRVDEKTLVALGKKMRAFKKARLK